MRLSVALETWIDAGVGETREALVRDGKPIALRILRASDEGRRARWGEVYAARVRKVDRGRGGAYLDLGLSEQDGYLPLDGAGLAVQRRRRTPVREGQGVLVSVAREAARGKNPVVALLESDRPGEAPRRVAQPECDLADAAPAAPDIAAELDAAVELALAPRVPIHGGGALVIEPTAALVAVDVDAGGRSGGGEPERFALNLAAAREAARQLRLRNLGGLICIDFVNMRMRAHQQLLAGAVREAFAGDPWSVKFGALSRFCVFELARAQLRTPLHEQMCDADGRESVETVALKALRLIERAARSQPGREIACTLAPAAMAWLEQDQIAWRAELSARIGVRWGVEAAADAHWPRDKIDVRAL